MSDKTHLQNLFSFGDPGYTPLAPLIAELEKLLQSQSDVDLQKEVPEVKIPAIEVSEKQISAPFDRASLLRFDLEIQRELYTLAGWQHHFKNLRTMYVASFADFFEYIFFASPEQRAQLKQQIAEYNHEKNIFIFNTVITYFKEKTAAFINHGYKKACSTNVSFLQNIDVNDISKYDPMNRFMTALLDRPNSELHMAGVLQSIAPVPIKIDTPDLSLRTDLLRTPVALVLKGNEYCLSTYNSPLQTGMCFVCHKK